jgi:hypothetical protein
VKLILLLVAVAALINIAASVVVLRVSAFSSSQRLLQLAFIWLVPIIGAAVCVAFASSQAFDKNSPRTMDPLHLPSDGGAPDGIGICGCSGTDSGGDGGGD